MKPLLNCNINGQTLAIIGNASSIFSNTYGNLIDSYNLVCRINRGIIRDIRCQGSKFNIWAFSKINLIQDLIDEKNKIPIMIEINSYHEIIQELKLELNLKDKKQKPSTGMTTIKLLSLCEPKKISLFGFDWGGSKTFYEKDFYNRENLIWKTHNFLKEQKYIQENINCEIFY